MLGWALVELSIMEKMRMWERNGAKKLKKFTDRRLVIVIGYLFNVIICIYLTHTSHNLFHPPPMGVLNNVADDIKFIMDCTNSNNCVAAF